MRKIIGNTVGTNFNPDKVKPNADEIKKAVDNYLAENPPDGNITIDKELSKTSTNPVENRVITARFSGIDTTIGNIDALLNTI